MRYEASKANYNQDVVIITSSWRSQIESLSNEKKTVLKRSLALEEFKEEMTQKNYEDFRTKFENERKSLTNREQQLLETLDRRLKEVETQLKEISEFIVNLKISWHMGDIDEDIYQHSNTSLQVISDRLHLEEDDLRFALNELSDKSSLSPPTHSQSLPISKPKQQVDVPIKLHLIE